MQILWLAEQRQLKRKLGHSCDNPWSYRKSGFWATKSTSSCLERKKQLTAMTMKIFLTSDFIVQIEPQNMFLQNYLLLSNCRSLSQKFQSWCLRWVNVIHHFMNETKWWRRLNCDRPFTNLHRESGATTHTNIISIEGKCTYKYAHKYTGCFFTGTPPKSSKYKKVNLG